METQEALKKIEEINAVIQSSNKAVFSGRPMILAGILALVAMPTVNLTNGFTFGHDFGVYQDGYSAFVSIIFFYTLAYILSKFIPGTSFSSRKKSLHPTIRKAFGISQHIGITILGVVGVLSLTNQTELIYPLVLILIGLMFTIYGSFSNKQITIIAWSYIFCGLLHLYLNQYHIPQLGMYFLIYNGLSYIYMGVILLKEEKAHAY